MGKLQGCERSKSPNTYRSFVAPFAKSTANSKGFPSRPKDRRGNPLIMAFVAVVGQDRIEMVPQNKLKMLISKFIASILSSLKYQNEMAINSVLSLKNFV